MDNTTLTIEAGTEIQFQPHVGLLILGQLKALGSKENRIKFKPAVDVDWPMDIGDNDPTIYGDLRLTDGPSSWYGRLEIYARGLWLPVYLQTYYWEQEESEVACRQLGLGPPVGSYYAYELNLQRRSLQMHYWYHSNIQCNGHEEKLADCQNYHLYPCYFCISGDTDFDRHNLILECSPLNRTETISTGHTGFWGGVRIIGNSNLHQADSILQYVDIIGAGQLHKKNSPGLLLRHVSPKIEHLSVIDCASFGIFIDNPTTQLTLSETTVSSCATDGILLNHVVFVPVIFSNVFIQETLGSPLRVVQKEKVALFSDSLFHLKPVCLDQSPELIEVDGFTEILHHSLNTPCEIFISNQTEAFLVEIFRLKRYFDAYDCNVDLRIIDEESQTELGSLNCQSGEPDYFQIETSGTLRLSSTIRSSSSYRGFDDIYNEFYDEDLGTGFYIRIVPVGSDYSDESCFGCDGICDFATGSCVNGTEYLGNNCTNDIDVQFCKPGWPVVNRGGFATAGWTMVSPDQQFQCYGQVTSWRYYGRNNPFTAIVWRPIPGSDTAFQIIGINDIPVGAQHIPVTYNVPEAERIRVQPGDVIGWSFGISALTRNYGGSYRVRWLGGNLYGSLVVNQILDINAGVGEREYSIEAIAEQYEPDGSCISVSGLCKFTGGKCACGTGLFGNTCSLNDTEPPVIGNCEHFVQFVLSSDTTVAVNNTLLAITDNSGQYQVTSNSSEDTLISVEFNQTIAYTAYDASGNTATCISTLEMKVDDEEPAITNCVNYTEYTSEVDGYIVVDYPEPTISDNSDRFQVTVIPPRDTLFLTGTVQQRITYHVVDSVGLEAECSFFIEVRYINDCTLSTDNCDTNASCTNTNGSFICTCNAGYSGDGVTCTELDECTLDTDNCDTNASCTNTVGSFTCACNTGYSGDGVTCTDVDECFTGPCDSNATCSNIPGSFDCICNAGFDGDGLNCTDDDECLSSLCDPNATCSNTPGSFECNCNAGFSGDGLSCVDDDECLSSPCDPNATCSNTPGSFECTCNAGFNGDGFLCADDDECLSSPCDHNGVCSNNIDSFDCTCNSGFSGDGLSCVDVDECLTSPCDSNAACTNTPGSFGCTCNAGFNGDGLSCTDNDECLSSPCDPNATCSNTPGSVDCTCNAGFSGDGLSCTDDDECLSSPCDHNAVCSNNLNSFECTCILGFSGDGLNCTDINECILGTDHCDTNAACINTIGSFTCTCNAGYSGDGVTCTDLNECLLGTHNCDANAACTNTDGSFTCECKTGYSGDGVTCTDLDECFLNTDNCDTNANCGNNDGSFTCECNSGYSGDGVLCTDLDECTLGTHNCDANAACTNDDGFFTCTCNTGYNGDGIICEDLEECTLDTHNCDANAACTNADGSFTCTCKVGYNGDGVTCTDLDECMLGTHDCHANAACTNTDGSFTCACNAGYSGDGVTCTDMNECMLGTHICHANAACTNTDGSFTCECNSGYSGDGETCTDMDECMFDTDNCDANAACTNTDGSFTCACNAGYSGDGVTCTDDDECLSSPCDSNAACSNNIDSFDCTCNAGFNGDGLSCTDDDECLSSPCDANASCSNSPGSFDCTCDAGFSGDGFNCADIDECLNGPCDTNAACSNTHGSFDCTCKAGFSGDGLSCTDDEAPTFSYCPDDIEVLQESLDGSAIVEWVQPTANDNDEQEVDVQIHDMDFQSGNSFSVGEYSIVYTATDQAGNEALCSFTLNVFGYSSMISAADELVVRNGEELAYSCTISSSVSRSPEMYWTLDEDVIAATKASVLSDNDPNIILTSSVPDKVVLQEDCNKVLACWFDTTNDENVRPLASAMIKVAVLPESVQISSQDGEVHSSGEVIKVIKGLEYGYTCQTTNPIDSGTRFTWTLGRDTALVYDTENTTDCTTEIYQSQYSIGTADFAAHNRKRLTCSTESDDDPTTSVSTGIILDVDVAPRSSQMSLKVVNANTPLVPGDPPICLYHPGDEYEFECVVNATKPAANVMWMFDGQEQTPDDVTVLSKTGLENVNTLLTKTLTTESHNGKEMSCVASNSASALVEGDASLTLLLQDITAVTCQFSREYGDPLCPGVAYCSDIGNTGHQCLCPEGYTDTNDACSDTNDCIESPCPSEAICINVLYGYGCICPTGFNDTRCEGCIDSDGVISQPCVDILLCDVYQGGFSCDCPSTGYLYDKDTNDCIDIEAPTLTCPSDIDESADVGEPSTRVSWSDVVVRDNSNELVQVSTADETQSGSLFTIGVHTVEFQAVDADNNSASCSFQVTITDDEAPQITCPESVELTADPGSSTAGYDWDTPTVTDNSGESITPYSTDIPSNRLFSIGPSVAYIYYAKDSSGNRGFCVFTVKVIDMEPPEITCPPDQEFQTESGLNTAVMTWDDPYVVDNSNQDVTLESNIEPGSSLPIGSHDVTYDAIDLEGNTASCSFTVRILDAEVPILTCPADITMSFEPSQTTATVTWDDATAMDNSGDITERPQSDIASGSIFESGETTVTYTAADSSGNIGECSFVVTLVEYDVTTIPSTTLPPQMATSARTSVSSASELTPAVTDITMTDSTSISKSSEAATSPTPQTDQNASDMSTPTPSIRTKSDGPNLMTSKTQITTRRKSTTTEQPTITCTQGFQYNGQACVDVNECLDSGSCSSVSLCQNNIGSFTCICRNGYRDVSTGGVTRCLDINECNDDTLNNCGENAICVNEIGSHTCMCPGTSITASNGRNCPEPSDPCDEQPCANRGECNLVSEPPGSGYRCTCVQGFIGNNCDIEELPAGVLEVVEHPTSHDVQVYNSVTLSCEFDNAASVTWYHDSVPIIDAQNQNRLRISMATPSDQGYYFCEAEGVNGETESTSVAAVRTEGVSTFPTSARFPTLAYNESLADSQSDYFKLVVKQIQRFVEPELQNFPGIDSPPMVQIKRLSSGSVIANMNIFTSETTRELEARDMLHSALVDIGRNSAGFLDDDSIIVESTAICERLECVTEYGFLVFPSGRVNDVIYSNGTCVCGSEPIGQVECLGDFISSPQLSCADIRLNCDTGSPMEQLQELKECDITPEVAPFVTERVERLTSMDDMEFSSEGLDDVATILSKLSDLNTADAMITNMVVSIVDNLMDLDTETLADSQMSHGATNRVVIALESFLDTVDLSDGMYMQNRPNLGLEVRDIPVDGLEFGLSFFNPTLSTEPNMTIAVQEGEAANANTVASSLQLPASIANHPALQGNDSTRLVVTIYRDASLFVAPHMMKERNRTLNYHDRTINTQVVSVNFGTQPLTNLQDPVTTTYQLIEYGDHVNNSACVFWDFAADNGRGNWSREGCELVNGTEKYIVQCRCNHLTNFATLMDIYGPDTRLTAVQDDILRFMSYIGCGLSILGLTITVFTYAPDKKQRAKLPNKILLGLCSSLIGLYITTVIMIAMDTTRNVAELGVIPCSILAGLVHFFLLSTLAWTVVEAVNMYLLFVKVFNVYIQNFMRKALLFVLGGPLLVVGITAGVTRENYARRDACFLESVPLLASVIGPITIMLIFNIIIYVLIMIKLSKPTPGKVGRAKRSKTSTRLKNAAIFLLLLGLTWSVGYLTLIRAATFIFQLLFCLLNSMKGYFIFMVYVIRRPEARRYWSARVGSKFISLRSKTFSSDTKRVTSARDDTRDNSRSQPTKPDMRRSSFAPNTIPLSEVERIRLGRREDQQDDINFDANDEQDNQMNNTEMHGDEETQNGAGLDGNSGDGRRSNGGGSNSDVRDEEEPILGADSGTNNRGFRHGYF
ncbi:uncharacterized protein [Amphiura filiformis]|uniref:uncharacterized protein n=1 Tax=Amphiura filiformis TaxID=82378 RepID=UPI003B2141C5